MYKWGLAVVCWLKQATASTAHIQVQFLLRFGCLRNDPVNGSWQGRITQPGFSLSLSHSPCFPLTALWQSLTAGQLLYLDSSILSYNMHTLQTGSSTHKAFRNLSLPVWGETYGHINRKIDLLPSSIMNEYCWMVFMKVQINSEDDAVNYWTVLELQFTYATYFCQTLTIQAIYIPDVSQ